MHSVKRSALTLMLTPALAAVLVGCGTSASSSAVVHPATAATAPVHAQSTTTASSAAPARCTTVSAPAPKGPQHLKAPTLKLTPAKTYTVTVATNCGTFAFTLDVKQQPKTAASFYYLVKRGFFNGLTFHRIVPGFVIQGGDPLGNGSGGPGYTVVEAPPANATYPVGTVAMAKTQAQPNGASGSQFFVMTGTSGLPAQYAIAGKVVSGINVVQTIGSLPTNQQTQMPNSPVVMQRVTVSAS